MAAKRKILEAGAIPERLRPENQPAGKTAVRNPKDLSLKVKLYSGFYLQYPFFYL